MPSDIKEALGMGALGYLAKPFDPMMLVSQINSLLAPVGCTIGG
jgi:DNA-binding response OmpR family regulator